MYFKITNKESKMYQDVMAYIKKRRKQTEDNYKTVEDRLGKFTKTLSSEGGFYVLPTISGIVPTEVTEIEGMIPDKKYPDVLVPNRRTKKGKEIQDFLNRLPNWWYTDGLDLFPMKRKDITGERFYTPYIEEFDGIIVVRLDDKHNPQQTEDFVEITTSEFKAITKIKDA